MSSRENRSATTFWMLDDVKDQAKDKARLIGTTLTDLINDAVEYYINNLDNIDPEKASKANQRQLGQEIKDQPKIKQMEQEIQDLKDKINRMNEVDHQVTDLQTEIDQLRKNMEGEYLQSIVRTYIDSKVGKTIEELQRILQKLG